MKSEVLTTATLAGLAALPVIVLPAWAHHGWGSYDSAKVLTLTAPVIELRYQNPHGEILIEQDGKRWIATLAPVSRMQARGLRAADLKPGTKVTVEGYPSKLQDGELRAERITVAGKTVELR